MSESGAHSQRILAIVVIFFSSYIVGIYSAARASSQLLQLQQQQQNHSRHDEANLDALDEAEALALNGSELALARNGTRNPRCKYLWNELKCEQVKVSLTALCLLRIRAWVLSAIRLFCSHRRWLMYVCGSHFNYHPVRRFRAGLFSLRHALAPHLTINTNHSSVVSPLSARSHQIRSDRSGRNYFRSTL